MAQISREASGFIGEILETALLGRACTLSVDYADPVVCHRFRGIFHRCTTAGGDLRKPRTNWRGESGTPKNSRGFFHDHDDADSDRPCAVARRRRWRDPRWRIEGAARPGDSSVSRRPRPGINRSQVSHAKIGRCLRGNCILPSASRRSGRVSPKARGRGDGTAAQNRSGECRYLPNCENASRSDARRWR